MASRQLPVSTRLPVKRVIEAVDRLVREGAHYKIVHLDTLGTAHLIGPLRAFFERRGQHPTIVMSLNDSYSFLLSNGVLHHGVKTELYSRYAMFIERRLLPRADYVDVVSEPDLEWLRKLAPGARSRLVPLGVDAEAFSGPRRPIEWDILYLGSMCEQVFHWLRPALDAALPIVKRRSQPVRVAVAGPDATTAALRYFGERGVTHLGFVPDLSRLLRSSRMLLVSSRQRAGTPTKALQAMAAGTPVVGMEAVGSIPNGRDHDTYSCASDWEDLAARIERLMWDSDYGARLAAGGHELVRRQHAWPVVCETYLRFTKDAAAPG
jgi:glycosyltransferase involved in cell wall biosynthesis